MKAQLRKVLGRLVMIGGLILTCSSAQAFDSGSSGADGAFNPTADIVVPLPPDGVFNYTTVDIPAGVTVTYTPNVANTPVTMLASGDVTIAGTINVSGQNGGSGESGIISSFANLIPGGPGGFAGGRGGIGGAATFAERAGGNGLGPGAGNGGTNGGCAGGGAGFGFVGTNSGCTAGIGGGIYGSTRLLPLIGGSGGGGGGGGRSTGKPGGAGGGGGGAILIASSATINITGSLTANGGTGGTYASNGDGAAGGGGGSGGAIRIVATAISGAGSLGALSGTGGSGGVSGSNDNAGTGGKGRIRLEADEPIAFNGSTDPFPSVGQTQALILPGLPTIRIASVAGAPVSPTPSGSDDVVLPSDTPNPMTIGLASSNVPLGQTITLTVTPDSGASITAVSSAIVGTEANGTADASVALPSGHSVLSATVSFTVTASLGDALKHFAHGERVQRIVSVAGLGQGSRTTFVTVSGKQHTWPSSAGAVN